MTEPNLNYSLNAKIYDHSLLKYMYNYIWLLKQRIYVKSIFFLRNKSNLTLSSLQLNVFFPIFKVEYIVDYN